MQLMESKQDRTARQYKGGGYAHFPGTGPRGMTCFGCQFCVQPKKSKTRYCEKNREIVGRWTKAIDPSAPACRHFIEAPSDSQ